MKKLLMTALTAVVLATTGCSMPPAPGTVPVTSGDPAYFWFRVAVYDASNPARSWEVARTVQLIVTGYDANNNVTNIRENGVDRPGPYVAAVRTPWVHEMKLDPLVVRGQVRVDYLFQIPGSGLPGPKADEILACWQQNGPGADGVEIPGTRVEARTASGIYPGTTSTFGAVVRCPSADY